MLAWQETSPYALAALTLLVLGILMARAGAASGTAEPLVAAAAVEHVAP